MKVKVKKGMREEIDGKWDRIVSSGWLCYWC